MLHGNQLIRHTIKYNTMLLTSQAQEERVHMHHPVNTTFSEAALFFTAFADDDEMTNVCDSL